MQENVTQGSAQGTPGQEVHADRSLILALIPLVALFALLGLNVALYGDDSLSGANQTALIIAAALAAAISLFLGVPWVDIQEKMLENIRAATPAILILLMVGALVGTWLIGGIVPTMIYYGLQIFSPAIFIVSCCVLTAIASIVIGSSWSTSATLGVAMMSIGYTLGFNPGLVAGAIISGAYFGDKMSPLSDTTNLASGVTGVDLFTHIRYLSMTSVPSILLTLLLYLLIGLFLGTPDVEDTTTAQTQAILAERFNLSPLLLLVPFVVIFLIVKRVAALPALFVGVLLGVASALVLQYPLLVELSDEFGGPYQVIMQAVYGDIALPTDNVVLDELLQSGGMAGMLNTIWLIISAMTFGGVMEASGFLQKITRVLISRVRSVGGLVTATGGTCVLTNVSASDQYLSVVVPGRMFINAYKDRGLARQNLSRTLEDCGTVTSVLVPWNTCGAFHAGVLGVATLSYAPWALFCLISPCMTMLFAWLQIRIARDEVP
ncbi:MAG: Na+/H+ antiporter NhaC [Pseudomonadales bacterium]|nr:Na+/H+ antiporter NhaC [Pseudomonadales bacterium]MCP5358550.1 Na+/H+ antiporter NhaC [Pseudomonadales bacterium]